MTKEIQTAVIIAKGEFPSHPYPLTLLKKTTTIICLDGALNTCLKHNITPTAIVGDGDSLAPELKKKYSSILHLYSDQETNDLTKAIIFCQQRGIKEINILAGTGKREDHTLGNIFLLIDYMDSMIVEMITDYGIFTPIDSTQTFRSFKGQQVSIFNFDQTPLSSSNLKYPLNNLKLDKLWKATLNESLADTFTITTTSKTIVYRTFSSHIFD